MAFFDFWRKRCTFIHNLDFNKQNYEANVLLWASLDALSNLWSKNFGKELCTNKSKHKRLIFDAFLAYYGGDLFQLVSLPDVWNRIDQGDWIVEQKKKLKLPDDVCVFLGKIGERQLPTPLDEYQLRQISDDWSMDIIVTTILSAYPNTDRAYLEKWLASSRYGAIAYKEMRSAYIHEGRFGKGAHNFELYNSTIQPTYLSPIYATPPTIGFKVEFMLVVLEQCINAFEADALECQKSPLPNSTSHLIAYPDLLDTSIPLSSEQGGEK